MAKPKEKERAAVIPIRELAVSINMVPGLCQLCDPGTAMCRVVEDGLKPVQRRILHAMKEMDDGRFNGWPISSARAYGIIRTGMPVSVTPW